MSRFLAFDIQLFLFLLLLLLVGSYLFLTLSCGHSNTRVHVVLLVDFSNKLITENCFLEIDRELGCDYAVVQSLVFFL